MGNLPQKRSTTSRVRPLEPLSTTTSSHRIFPTKAIALWMSLPPVRRTGLVSTYFELSGGFEAPRVIDRSPTGADPLWVVAATRKDAPELAIG